LQTGIQKVVRQLSSAWSRGNFDCSLVIFQNGQYRVLPQTAFEDISLMPWARYPRLRFRRKIERMLRLIYSMFKRFIPLRIRIKIKMSKMIHNLELYFNTNLYTRESKILDPNDINLLILEIVFQSDHQKFVKDVISQKNINVTFFSYDLIPVNYRQYVPPEFSAMFESYLEIAKISNKLWSISKSTKGELEAYVGNSKYLKGSQFKWLPPSSFAKCKHDSPIENPNGVEYFLFVSSFETRKNHLGFLEALRILKATGVKIPKVVFVGGTAWEGNPITTKIDALRSEGFDFEALVNISECCVGNLYQHASLTVYPSLIEGFGLPVVESLSFGVPALTSDVGSTAELLKIPGTMGFISGDSQDLAKQLNSFLTDPLVRQKITQEARSGKDKFENWSDYAKDLYDFATK
jgi:glycosyltransferase involved in cell wall biosynthesis